MPELPEVQTIVSDLRKKIIGREITGVWFDAPKIIKKPKAQNLEKIIRNLKVIDVKRKGKNILIYLSGGFLLLVHQKMTGHLLYGKWRIANGKATSILKGPLEEKVNDYIHLIFYLDNGKQLALSDLRKFAKVLFGEKEEIENSPDLKKLGPDPTSENFTFKDFKNIFNNLSGRIKQALMNQEVISGIGNIYADEILWYTKVHPLRIIKDIKEKELKNIYNATGKILKKAIKLRGTSISDFRDTAGKPGAYADIRYVYRTEGLPCKRCGEEIKRIKIGGRSAHYCPNCQKIH